MSLQGTVIRTIFQTAASLGGAFDKLCQLSGLRPEDISDSERMVEWEKAALIWVLLLKLTNDPLIGLHVGIGTDKLLLNTASGLTGQRIKPLRIELSYERRGVDEYRNKP